MMAVLTEKERYLISDLQEQEKTCIQKYERNEREARDEELRNLFESLKKDEQKHFDSLSQVLQGTVPAVNSADNAGQGYNPTATYTGDYKQEDKDNDSFLCTDSISVEKYVASAYNFDLFQFGDEAIRKLLNDIQTEEQNHAEKIYKYKTVNQMA